jgi:hypothetical protein
MTVVMTGGAWMRNFLLRAQGKLRMMTFDQLTQVRDNDCYVKVAIQPSATFLSSVINETMQKDD